MTIDWPTIEDRHLALVWRPACAAVEQLVEFNESFAFVPVLVPSRGAARALGVVLRDRGWTVHLIEPRTSNEWRAIFQSLTSIEPSAHVVIVHADDRALGGLADGLDLLNQRRDTVAARLPSTLLWCGSGTFLRDTAVYAADLWSIRELTQKLEFNDDARSTVTPTHTERELLGAVAVGGCNDASVWREFSAACESSCAYSEAASAIENAAFFTAARTGESTRAVRLYEQALGTAAVTWTAAQDDPWDPLLAIRQRARGAAQWRAQEHGTISRADLVDSRLAIDVEPGHLGARTQWLLTGAWRGGGAVIERVRVHEQRLHAGALEALWTEAQRTQIRTLDSNACFVRLLFACGFLRVGRQDLAKQLVSTVEEELPRFDEGADGAGDPNPILFRMYIKRCNQEAAATSSEHWQRNVEDLMHAVPSARRWNRAELFRKRSVWLRGGSHGAIRPTWQHRDASQVLEAAEADPSALPDALVSVFTVPALHDREITDAIERALLRAELTHNSTLLAATLEVAQRHLGRIAIFGHRAAAIAACIRAVALVGDAASIDTLLDYLLHLVTAADGTFRFPDLLLAVRPAVSAAWQRGISAATVRIVEALSPIAQRSSRDSLHLRALLAELLLLLGDPSALDRLDSAIEDTLDGSLDYHGRFDVMCTALQSLHRWPISIRVLACRRVFRQIDTFGDNFTTRRFYATYKLLMIERLIDALTAPEPAVVDVIDREYAASVDHLVSVGALKSAFCVRRPAAPPLSALLSIP